MKRFLMVSAVIAGMLLLSACAASRQAYYDADAKAAEANALAVKAKFDALAAAAANCDTEGCSGMAMMGIALTETPRAQAIPQYSEPWLRALQFGERAISIGANVYGQKIQADALIGLAGVVSENAGDRSQRFDYSDHSTTNVDNSVAIADSYNSDDDTSGDTDSNNTDTDVSGVIVADSTDTAVETGAGDQSVKNPDSSNPGNCDGVETCNPVTNPEPPRAAEQPEG